MLKVPSGRVFVGAAEEVTSDGLEPEGVRGGVFLDVERGTCLLSVLRMGTDVLLCFGAANGAAINGFVSPIRT